MIIKNEVHFDGLLSSYVGSILCNNWCSLFREVLTHWTFFVMFYIALAHLVVGKFGLVVCLLFWCSSKLLFYCWHSGSSLKRAYLEAWIFCLSHIWFECILLSGIFQYNVLWVWNDGSVPWLLRTWGTWFSGLKRCNLILII